MRRAAPVNPPAKRDGAGVGAARTERGSLVLQPKSPRLVNEFETRVV
jgi:hypothetical protein